MLKTFTTRLFSILNRAGFHRDCTILQYNIWPENANLSRIKNFARFTGAKL